MPRSPALLACDVPTGAGRAAAHFRPRLLNLHTEHQLHRATPTHTDNCTLEPRMPTIFLLLNYDQARAPKVPVVGDREGQGPAGRGQFSSRGRHSSESIVVRCRSFGAPKTVCSCRLLGRWIEKDSAGGESSRSCCLSSVIGRAHRSRSGSYVQNTPFGDPDNDG